MKKKLVKKKNRKGFTLIELLAVILILGIIALIAIPTVNSVIEQSRKGAATSSAAEYIRKVEEKVVLGNLNNTVLADGRYEVGDLSLDLKGTLPDSGYFVLTSGEVSECSLIYGAYVVTCNGEKFDVDKNVVVEEEEEEEENKVSYEDINSNSSIDFGDKVCIDTECFYVLTNSGSRVRMLAEYNLGIGYKYSNGESNISTNSVFSDATKKVYFIRDINYVTINDIKQSSSATGKKYSDVTHYRAEGSINFGLFGTNYVGYWDNGDKLKSQYGGTLYTTISSNKNNAPYIYDENSTLYPYIQQYVSSLNETLKIDSITGELMRLSDVSLFGCNASSACNSTYSWLYNSAFWLGNVYDKQTVFAFIAFSHTSYYFTTLTHSFTGNAGLRPVIEMDVSLIK